MASLKPILQRTILLSLCAFAYACGGGGGGGGGTSGPTGQTPTPTATPTPDASTPTPTPTPTETPVEDGPYVEIDEYVIYDNEVNSDLSLDYYDNGEFTLAITTETEGDNSFLTVDKPNADGNIFFTINSAAQDLSYWEVPGVIAFKVRINTGPTDLLVKMDSVYPEVSSKLVSDLPLGVWQEVKLNVSSLSGTADITGISNIIVFETTDAGNFSIDNIRFEIPFAPKSLFTIYDDVGNADLIIGKWDKDTGSTTVGSTPEDGRGTVLTMNRDGDTGNIFFSFAGGAKDMSHWIDDGVLAFDMKVVSGTASSIDIKIDSNWPAIGYKTFMPEVGEWESYNIPISELLDGTGDEAVDMTALVNAFVAEPVGGTMEVYFDNIRWEVAQ